MSIFSSVPITKLSRSTFNLDHENKCSFNFGGIYPLLCQTILPGDQIGLALQSFVRTVPLLSPVMHRNDIKVDAFFVPMRLIWDNYEKWLMCSDASIKMPQIYLGDSAIESTYNSFMGVGSLADYLGFASVPYSTLTSAYTNAKISDRKMCALPFRAYQLIYDFYFRNKALESSLFDNTYYDIKSNNDLQLGIPDSPYDSYFFVRNRSWRRDVFTAALPDPQKGNPVLLPESDLSVKADGNLTGDFASQKDKDFMVGGSSRNVYMDGTSTGTEEKLTYNSGLKVEKSNSPTIEDFRYAEVLEEYEEALARSGSGSTGSFKEWLLSIWRQLSPDARLDRPEYLGGYRGPIQISEIAQTSSATETSPQGTLAGKGLSVGGQRLFRKKIFKEPGYLMVTMSIVPKSAYFQGDPRQFLYKSCFDFPNPYFANLGEQEVFTQEINAAAAICDDTQQKTFGYNVRNYEMKQIPDSIHGDLRNSLLFWHEARIFNDTFDSEGNFSQTNLNEAFVKMYSSEAARIFPSVETSDKLIGQFFFTMRGKRSLPYYGVPRVGHSK